MCNEKLYMIFDFSLSRFVFVSKNKYRADTTKKHIQNSNSHRARCTRKVPRSRELFILKMVTSTGFNLAPGCDKPKVCSGWFWVHFSTRAAQFFKMKFIPGINFILKTFFWQITSVCCNVCLANVHSHLKFEHRKIIRES